MFALRPLGAACPSGLDAQLVNLDPAVTRFILGREGAVAQLTCPLVDGVSVHIQKLNLTIPEGQEDSNVSRKQAELVRGDNNSLSLKSHGENGVGLIRRGQSRVIVPRGDVSPVEIGDKIILNGFKRDRNEDELLVFELVAQTNTAENEEPDTTLEAIARLERALADTIAAKTVIEQENAHLLESAETARAQATAVQEELATFRAGLQDEKDEDRKDLEEAQAQAAAAQEELATFRAGLQDEKDESTKSLEEAQAQTTAAQEELATFRAGLQDEKDKSTKSLETAQAHAAAAREELATFRAGLQDEKDESTKSLEEAQAQTTAAQEELATFRAGLQDEKDESTKSLETAQAHAAAAREELATFRAGLQDEKDESTKSLEEAQAQAAAAQEELATFRAGLESEKQRLATGSEAALRARALAAVAAGAPEAVTAQALRGLVEEFDEVVGCVHSAHAASLAALAAQRGALSAKAHAAAEASKEPRCFHVERLKRALREAYAEAPRGQGLAAVGRAVKAEVAGLTSSASEGGCGGKEEAEGTAVKLSALVELLQSRLEDVTSARRFVVCGALGWTESGSAVLLGRYHNTKTRGDVASGLNPLVPGSEIIPAAIEDSCEGGGAADMTDDSGSGFEGRSGGGDDSQRSAGKWLRVETVLGRGPLFVPLFEGQRPLLKQVSGEEPGGEDEDENDAAAAAGSSDGGTGEVCLELNRAAVAVVQAWVRLACDLSHAPPHAQTTLAASTVLRALHAATQTRAAEPAARPSAVGGAAVEGGCGGVECSAAGGIPVAIWEGLAAARDLLATAWPSRSSAGPGLAKEHPLASEARLAKLERDGCFPELGSLARELGGHPWHELKACVLTGNARQAALLAHRFFALPSAGVAAARGGVESGEGKIEEGDADPDTAPSISPHDASSKVVAEAKDITSSSSSSSSSSFSPHVDSLTYSCPIKVLQENLRRPGSTFFERYETIKSAETAGEFKRLGGTTFELSQYIKQGCILICSGLASSELATEARDKTMGVGGHADEGAHNKAPFAPPESDGVDAASETKAVAEAALAPIQVTACQALWALAKLQELSPPPPPSASPPSSATVGDRVSSGTGPRGRALCAVVLVASAVLTRRHQVGDDSLDGASSSLSGWSDPEAVEVDKALEVRAWASLQREVAFAVFAHGVDDETCLEVAALGSTGNRCSAQDVAAIAVSDCKASVSTLAAHLFRNALSSPEPSGLGFGGSAAAPVTAEAFLGFAASAKSAGQRSAAALLYACALTLLDGNGGEEKLETETTPEVQHCLSNILDLSPVLSCAPHPAFLLTAALTVTEGWGEREECGRRAYGGRCHAIRGPLRFSGDSTVLAANELGELNEWAGARIVALDHTPVASRQDVQAALLASRGAPPPALPSSATKRHKFLFEQRPCLDSDPPPHGSHSDLVTDGLGAAALLSDCWVGTNARRAERAAERALGAGRCQEAGLLAAVALQHFESTADLDRVVGRFLGGGGGGSGDGGGGGGGAAAAAAPELKARQVLAGASATVVRAACLRGLEKQAAECKCNHAAFKRVLKVVAPLERGQEEEEELSEHELRAACVLALSCLRLELLASPTCQWKEGGKEGALAEAASSALALASRVGAATALAVAEELAAALASPQPFSSALAVLDPKVSSPNFNIASITPTAATHATAEVAFRVGVLIAAAASSSGGAAACHLLSAANSLPSLAVTHLLDSLESEIGDKVCLVDCPGSKEPSYAERGYHAAHTPSTFYACKTCKVEGCQVVGSVRSCRCAVTLLGFSSAGQNSSDESSSLQIGHDERLTRLVGRATSKCRGQLCVELAAANGKCALEPLVFPDFSGVEQPVFDVRGLELTLRTNSQQQQPTRNKKQQPHQGNGLGGDALSRPLAATITAETSVGAAADFCASFFAFDAGLADSVARAVSEQEVDGSVLASMSEADLREVLGEVAFHEEKDGEGGSGGVFALTLDQVRSGCELGAWLALRRLSLSVVAQPENHSDTVEEGGSCALLWTWLTERVPTLSDLPTSYASSVREALDWKVALSLTEEELGALTAVLSSNGVQGLSCGSGEAVAATAARGLGRALSLLGHLDPRRPGQRGGLANASPLPRNTAGPGTLFPVAGTAAETSTSSASSYDWLCAQAKPCAAREEEEAAAVEGRFERELLTVVVLGNTGAGKSTLLNSLLGEAVLLPTNCMRACTATIVEMLHLSEAPCFSPCFVNAVQAAAALSSSAPLSAPPGAVQADNVAAASAEALPKKRREPSPNEDCETQPFFMPEEEEEEEGASSGDKGEEEEEEEGKEAGLWRFAYHASVHFISGAEWKRDVVAAIRHTRRLKDAANASSSSDGAETEASAEVMKLRSTLGALEADRLLDAATNSSDPKACADASAAAGSLFHHPKVHPLLGTTKPLAAADSPSLHELLAPFVDSANQGENGGGDDCGGGEGEGGGGGGPGALWPLVGKVRVFGPWSVLSSGVRLVDSPGLADDNSARDQVVRGYIQRADSVLLVSNVRRATNDKTVKDWLSPALRRTLLGSNNNGNNNNNGGAATDSGGSSSNRSGSSGSGSGGNASGSGGGAFGDLAFVVTQTDCVVRSEAIENLGLPEDTSLLDVAQARNAFVKQKLTDDFFHGIEWRHLPANKAFLKVASREGSSGDSVSCDGTSCMFEEGIRKVLRECHPRLEITPSAIRVVDLLCEDFCGRILAACVTAPPSTSNTTKVNSNSGCGGGSEDDDEDDDDGDLFLSVTTVCEASMQRAVTALIGDTEVLKHALSEGNKAVAAFAKKETGVSTPSIGSSSSNDSSSNGGGGGGNKLVGSVSSGLSFSTFVVEARIAASPLAKRNASPKALVFLTAVLEYLAAEWLELSGNAALDIKSSCVTPWCVLAATVGDQELLHLPSPHVLRAMDASVAGCQEGGYAPPSNGEPGGLVEREGASVHDDTDAFQYPVFCVSSMDFQKATGVRGHEDGPPAVFKRDVRDTEVPALRAFIALASAQHRQRLQRQLLAPPLAPTAVSAAAGAAAVRKKAGDVFISCHKPAAGGSAAPGACDDGDSDGDEGSGGESAMPGLKRQKVVDSGSGALASTAVALSCSTSIPQHPSSSIQNFIPQKRALEPHPEDGQSQKRTPPSAPTAASVAVANQENGGGGDDEEEDEVIDLT